MRFAHIADTHIRNLRFHYEYNEVFKQLYQSLRDEEVDYIIHCGDIAHTKTQISPEFVDMATKFFANLAAIAPTYIILGNHDGNLTNSSREDAISPIVRAMNNKNIHLLKHAGETRIDDKFCLNVLSVFDEENWVDPTDYDSINIALYHGAINKSKTDSNWTLGGDHGIDIFEEFDFAFLGDIHKTQQLDDEGRIWYPGSTVQQNFGETLDKGYLLWDIESKDEFSNKLITFKNPIPYVTLALNEDGTLPDVDVPEGARLRLVAENNLTPDLWRKSLDIARFKFKPESLRYTNKVSTASVPVQTGGLKYEDLRNIKTQNRLISEFLADYQCEEEVLQKVFELNSRLSKIAQEQEDVYRNINWSLQSLEWGGLFNYGQGNSIDFTKLTGTVGIFGKNFSGKSSIIDSMLYSIYNTTSKASSKISNIINEHSDSCYAKAVINIADKKYTVDRNASRSEKSATGAETGLEFSCEEDSGEVLCLNAMSKPDTDKNIRKYFGTIDDFYITSMATQLDSLRFIVDGSAKRKSALAKFLDLQVFDRKYEQAKEESKDLRGALKRLEGVDYDEQIMEAEASLLRKNESMEKNQEKCETLQGRVENLREQINSIGSKIESAPTEIIDPIKVGVEIKTRTKNLHGLREEKESLISKVENSKAKIKEITEFLSGFDIDTYEEKKTRIIENREQIDKYIKQLEEASKEKTKYQIRNDLLSEVPCGDSFPSCKFIKNAHDAAGLVQIKSDIMADIARNINSLGEEVSEMNPDDVLYYTEKFELLKGKQESVLEGLSTAEMSLERIESSIFKETTILEKLNSKMGEYEDNREAIENLEGLLSDKKSLQSDVKKYTRECNDCKKETNALLREVGSLEQQVKELQNRKEELKTLRTEFAAYDLFMKCFHNNGISHDIIKDRLPTINEEIAKVLTGVVDFDVFIENNEKRLDIFIKHPKHGARLIEMGSGAEKTIAAMAIRLSLLSVSSLPKPDIFILDEPGTALDAENMEGFVRIIDMVKSYFKTVILISHLDTLKDAVDMQIVIEKKDGFAHVSV